MLREAEIRSSVFPDEIRELTQLPHPWTILSFLEVFQSSLIT